MIRTLLLAAFIVAGTAAQAAEVTQVRPARMASPGGSANVWVGFAISRNGRVFQQARASEGDARFAAHGECEQTSQRSCNVIAVTSQADVIAIHCRYGNAETGYVGGSNIDYGAARWLAVEKAKREGYDPSDCREVYQY